MVVIGGPPGSGKSSNFPLATLGVDAFSVDDHCAAVLGSYEAISRSLRSVMAAECQRFVEDHIVQRRSFAVETTLRTRVCMEQAASANAAGFHTQMQFLATDSADENIRRVMARAQSGGHGASERDIRAIYDAALANLSAVVRVFHAVDIFDTTNLWEPPRLVASSARGAVVVHAGAPAWVRQALGV